MLRFLPIHHVTNISVTTAQVWGLYLIGEFTKRKCRIFGERHALWEHKYITQTGNNDELEYKVCVKAQVKNGPAVDANTHL